MAEKKKTTTKRLRTAASDGFTDAEKEAMRDRAREAKAQRSGKVDGEQDLREKIAAMRQPDRGMAERLHAIVMDVAPSLTPRTWYGMPAWAKDGKVLCFFQSAEKFGARYATFGFSDTASLDQGNLWPTSYALTELTDAEEKKIRTLVKKAAR